MRGSSFIQIGAPLQGLWYSTIAWGDVDGDGDLDAFRAKLQCEIRRARELVALHADQPDQELRVAVADALEVTRRAGSPVTDAWARTWPSMAARASAPVNLSGTARRGTSSA